MESIIFSNFFIIEKYFNSEIWALKSDLATFRMFLSLRKKKGKNTGMGKINHLHTSLSLITTQKKL